MNMRKTLLVSLALVPFLAVKGQMVRWVIPPVYDSICVAEGAPLLIGDSANVTIINTLEGERIAATGDLMHPFVEGFSVVTAHETGGITGFYDDDGGFVSLSECEVAYDYPYFSDGRLLVKKGDRYSAINTAGEETAYIRFVQVYPFNNGVATCLAYESEEKLKNPHYLHVTTDNKIVEYSYKEKVVEKMDFQFLSSMNDDGVGIAVVKGKIYKVNEESTVLMPVLATLDESNVKKQLAVVKEKDEFLRREDGGYTMKGKSGKTDFVDFYFDEFLRLDKICYADGEEVVYEEHVEEPLKYQSPLRAQRKGRKWGIVSDGGKEVLPPQFEEYGFAIGNYVAVCLDGKWGLLLYDEELEYRFLLNDGNDVGFRHKNRTVPIRLELPTIITADRCRFNLDKQSGCSIDKLSLETKNTEYGNYVQYKCRLAIPDSLPDIPVEVSYPVQITYDRLVYPVDSIKAKAWHVKYINVDLDESETFVENGKVSFTLNMTMVKEVGEGDYPFSVELLSDSLPSEIMKVSETRYVCRLDSLNEGVNYVNIRVCEEGCPPYIFPFEITHTTPVDDNGESKEDAVPEVTVKKKMYMELPKREGESLIPEPMVTDSVAVVI